RDCNNGSGAYAAAFVRGGAASERLAGLARVTEGTRLRELLRRLLRPGLRGDGPRVHAEDTRGPRLRLALVRPGPGSRRRRRGWGLRRSRGLGRRRTLRRARTLTAGSG